MEKIRYFSYSVMIRGFECTDTGAEHLAHVLVFHLFVILQIKHLSLFVRQLRHGLLKLQSGFIAIEIRITLQS